MHRRALGQHRRALVVLAAGGLIAAMLAVVAGSSAGGRRPVGGGGGSGGSGAPAGPVASTGGPRTVVDDARPPNIVYVLTDDLSFDLLGSMPAVQAMQRRGVTFNNFFVTDSLCCPSRSSIFTGDYPHNTGVFTNVGRDGGITAFYKRDNENRSFNVYLQQAGYRTGFMGKYLNGYLQGSRRSPVASTYIPPGWSEWDAAGYAYPEFDYELNQDGRLHYYGHQAKDYLTNVLANRGARFIRRSASAGKPFFLELATFAPHQPYVPAPRYKHAFPRLTAPRPKAFDRLPTRPPNWLQGHHALGPAQIRTINEVFRRRVQDVQSVDDLIDQIRAALRTTGQLRNTYIVFNSDNGLHTGEYRLMPGKLTAFDTDIHVPLASKRR